MGCSTFGKHLGLGHREQNALVDVAAVQGMLLNLGTTFCNFVGDFYRWILSLRTQGKESSMTKMWFPFLLK